MKTEKTTAKKEEEEENCMRVVECIVQDTDHTIEEGMGRRA